MQNFGKRHYAIEFDPWATKKPRKARQTASREREQGERRIDASRIAGYLMALVAVCVIAVASFEMLVLA